MLRLHSPSWQRDRNAVEWKAKCVFLFFPFWRLRFFFFLFSFFLFYRRVSEPVGTSTSLPLVSNGLPPRPPLFLSRSPACSKGWQLGWRPRSSLFDSGRPGTQSSLRTWKSKHPKRNGRSKSDQLPSASRKTVPSRADDAPFRSVPPSHPKRDKTNAFFFFFFLSQKNVPFFFPSPVPRPQECVQLMGTH